jgi:DUF971 family protein
MMRTSAVTFFEHMTIPAPTNITLHQKSKLFEIAFESGINFEIRYELLRVYSPSAEVRGHGPGQETLQLGKEDIDIVDVTTVGHYGIRPKFSDGHDSGIFTWEYLYELGINQEQFWKDYQNQLSEKGRG